MAEKRNNYSGNLKIGDTVLLYFDTERIENEKSTQKNGYIITDLSG